MTNVTVREDMELHSLDVSEWTPEEGFAHLKRTFDRAAATYPDLFESYFVELVETTDLDEQKKIMRAALSQTASERFGKVR